MESLAIVWLKRDLRWMDHAPMKQAIESGGKVVLLYIDRLELHVHPCYSERHFRFVQQSLDDLDNFLNSFGTKVWRTSSSIQKVLEVLTRRYNITGIHSHQETGVQDTFQLDKAFFKYCAERQVPWMEYTHNGVERGLKNRQNWVEKWYEYVQAPQETPDFKVASFLSFTAIGQLAKSTKPMLRIPESSNFQKGGTHRAIAYFESFVERRFKDYSKGISKPQLSRTSCSRLSPYLAWGNISVRWVYQRAKKEKQAYPQKSFKAFLDRLRWQAHFIQKFEMECSMEFELYNKGYSSLEKELNSIFLEAWRTGETGFPLVDACMRCLVQTGYLNFRMRAMLASFAMHHLWLPWKPVAHHLAKQFLDFEPGIHFPQIQMQSGMTGIHTLRIYNPTKQAQEHDEEGAFIRKWVPELQHVPLKYLYEPWTMPVMEQTFANCSIGEVYPEPLVDLKISGKKAREKIWNLKSDPTVAAEAQRILQKHTINPHRRMV
jgi:deoxyribodipyrimidine photo-lyase